MEFHLDRDIRLSEETEFKSLYSWSLQEFSRDGKAIGLKQVPWSWSLYFSASEVRVDKSIGIELSGGSNDGAATESTVLESDAITAILHPGICTDGKSVNQQASFSMFGTDRTIQALTLRIRPLPEGTSDERCQLWGCVSYTSEVDFRDDTVDDTIEIQMWVLPRRFENFRRAIESEDVKILRVRLGRVPGFYSEWSPAVTTRSVKVLAGGEEQAVVPSDGCAVSPPRLGRVGEFEVSVVTRTSLDLKQNLEPIDSDSLFRNDWAEEKPTQDAVQVEAPDLRQSMLSQLVKSEKAISSLKVPLWLIVIALVILILR